MPATLSDLVEAPTIAVDKRKIRVTESWQQFTTPYRRLFLQSVQSA